ncbi:MAG: hypothetical protein H3C62_07700 [Gemmatimonadaceae bacterium]|nr:hypothetical protein [Gemmatimonadaceae bacterium]
MPLVTLPHALRPRAAYVFCRALSIVIGVMLSAPAVRAQSIDSLTAALGSSALLVRASAVESLNRLPVSALPSATRDALIALLEREATGTQPVDPEATADDDEAWGEYIIGLAEVVQQLGDSRALRGLCLLGIQTSRSAQEYVASFGAQAIAPLREAWSTKPTSRPSVITTLALVAKSADSTTRLVVLQTLLAPDDTFPIAIADAAIAGNLFGLVPFLDSLARAPDLSPIAQGALQEAADTLRPQLTSIPAPQLLAEYEGLLAAICHNASGALQGYCESSENGIENSAKHLLASSAQHVQQGFTNQARQELEQVVARTVNAVSAGTLTAWQGIVIITGLQQVIARL